MILEQLGGNLGLPHHFIQPCFESPFHDISPPREPPCRKGILPQQLEPVNLKIQ